MRFKVEPNTKYSVNINATVYFFDENDEFIEDFDAVIKKYKDKATFKTPANCDRMSIRISPPKSDRRKLHGT